MNMILSCLIMLSVTFCSVGYCSDNFILSSIEEANALSKETKQPVLVIFGADDCVFCVNLKNDILNGSLDSVVDKYIICFVDIKTNPEYQNKYNIITIPDSRVIKNNVTIKKIIGYNKSTYQQKIESK